MPSEFREPKTLPQWIQLDYFRRRRALGWWRSRLTWLVFLGALAIMLVLLTLPWTTTLYQAGPVSEPHSMFNDDCAQCHQESFQTARRLWPFNHDVVAVSNEACSRCHEGALHYPGQTAEAHRCADCHQEHRGRTALARVPDRACLDCHKDLQKYHAGLPEETLALFKERYHGREFLDVTGFPVGHPEFGLWEGRDPRRAKPRIPGTPEVEDQAHLRFTHAKHLQEAGLLLDTLTPPDPLPPGWQLFEDKEGKKRARLDCAACHQADEAGRYMKPINYESHCAVCHPLSVGVTGEVPEAVKKAAEAFKAEPAPHRKPEIVRAVLRQRLVDFIEKNKLVPGKGGERLQGRLDPGTPAVREDVWVLATDTLTQAEKLLFINREQEPNERLTFGFCSYCHIEKNPGKREQGLPVYLETEVPDRWYPHSFFSHASHRMLACTECHPVRTSDRTSDVNLPRVASCAQCHNPTAGVRHDCTECHTYHDKRHGYGPPRGLKIDDVLKP
jgi:hypothetical protein